MKAISITLFGRRDGGCGGVQQLVDVAIRVDRGHLRSVEREWPITSGDRHQDGR